MEVIRNLLISAAFFALLFWLFKVFSTKKKPIIPKSDNTTDAYLKRKRNRR